MMKTTEFDGGNLVGDGVTVAQVNDLHVGASCFVGGE
jgi:hypothetical protein